MRQSLLILFLLFLITTGCKSKTVSTRAQESANAAPTPYLSYTDPSKLSRQEYMERLNTQLSEGDRRILEQADELELVSVNPSPLLEGPKSSTGKRVETVAEGMFAVIGKTKVADPEVKNKIIKALYDGFAASEWSMACFAPRHAIRARSKGKTVELVICFECLNFKGKGPEGRFGGKISHLPQEFFNTVLTSANIPLK